MNTPVLGDVYRMGTWPFADAVLQYVNYVVETVTLARPYIYASETGAPLVGIELIEDLSFATLETYNKVGQGRNARYAGACL